MNGRNTEGRALSGKQRVHVVQRVERLTRNQSVVSLSPTKGSPSLLEQETLHSLLSIGWF